MPDMPSEISVCALGASPDTGNLGVSALAESIVSGVARERPRAHLTLFDDGWGIRGASMTVDGRRFSYSLCGIRHSRRYYRPESVFNIRLSARLGGLRNRTLRAIQSADVVLDASGGDSFSDLYGRARFKAATEPKEIVLDQKRPLVLLPQTFGPFSSAGSRRTAIRILQGASEAWARDPDSFQVLRELLADDFDPVRHRLGVDMAFALEPIPIKNWDAAKPSKFDGPLAGVNVSGLLFNDITSGRQIELSRDHRRTLLLDYRRTMLGLVKRLVADGARVLLVPHVHHANGTPESDRSACRSLLEQLEAADRRRISMLPDGLTAGETKWMVGRCDWFCGTRMHSAIGALSSGIPTAAIAYSGKTAGVFAACGQREQVVDARVLSDQEAIESLWRSWLKRDQTRAALSLSAPRTVQRARSQWNEILRGAVARS